MTTIFNEKTSTDDILQTIDLTGKRIFITGVSSGIGLETARAVLAHGATVTGTARDVRKGADVLQAAAQAGGGAVELLTMDLADLTSVASVADRLRERGDGFDLVIANAGVMNTPFGHTADGFETQFGTNFLGHFALVNRLAPLMSAGARLIVLSSSAHRFSDIDLDDLNFERTPYDPSIAYARSKTACALLALAFDARHRGRGVRAATVHPGVIWTELARHMDPAAFDVAFGAMKARHLALGHAPFEFKTPAQGAATSLWAGLIADAAAVGGRYCEDCAISPILADADASIFVPGVRSYAIDPQRAEALWAKANLLLGSHF